LQKVGWTVKLRRLSIVLVTVLLLAGCVRDDVAITFKDANHGAITQQIRLSSQLTGVNRTAAELWLEKLGQQAILLGGQTRHPTAREWMMQIPFYNVKDLLSKFDQFFSVLTTQTDTQFNPRQRSTNLSNLRIQTNNLVLWQRHRLSYDLDLRSLRVVPNAQDSATLLINPQELLALEFTLKTPWGAKVPKQGEAARLTPKLRRSGSGQANLVWSLEPGQLNHLEAIFWIPSPVGIGAVLIVGFVLIGMFLKAWTNPSSLIDLPSVADDLSAAVQVGKDIHPKNH
jgi:hypothetical protein